MMGSGSPDLVGLLETHGQSHLVRFWDELSSEQRAALILDIESIDFALMDRLIAEWVLEDPPAEQFDQIDPVPLIPPADLSRSDAREAWDAGEEALRAGRVGLFLVAGGQGTRLGFPGPKGAYPIGPITGRTLFGYHAEKIRNLQRRYAVRLPWYIMVSDTNETETRAFFEKNQFFGLNKADIYFLRQRMVPCVDLAGKFMLADKHRLATNPNGHGGCLPTMVECGVIEDAQSRGVDTLSYFQVDNWAVRVADPFFVGYHVSRNAEMSSKNHRKNDLRESVGVHCLCDGQYRVIEYSELDIYPQLLETGPNGEITHAAGNPAIHILSTAFVERILDQYDEFPWHRAFKKIPYIDEEGREVKPEAPNGYKFETFIFDALRFVKHPPLCLEIRRRGEYTPIKQYDGSNSVVAARASMNEHWARWIEAAGGRVPREDAGNVAVNIEISPEFALWQDEFVAKVDGMALPSGGDIVVTADGKVLQ